MNNWKSNFDDQVLQRGYEYYLEGAVDQIIKTNDGYQATIAGHHLYHVSCVIEDGQLVSLKCDCPCHYPCKHVAALLYALDNNAKVLDQSLQDKEIDDLLKTIPTDSLVDLLKEACLTNYDFYQSLVIRYNQDLTGEQRQALKEELYYLNTCEYDYFYDDDSYIEYVDALAAFVKNKIGKLVDGNKLDFADEMLKEVIGEAIRYDVDECDYWVDELFDNIYEQLINLYEHGDETFKAKFVKELKDSLENRILSDIAEKFIIDYLQDRKFQEDKLSEFEELIQNDTYGIAVFEKTALMKKMGYSEVEIEDVYDENYEKRMVREYLVKRCISEGQELKAMDILEDSLELDGKRSDDIKELMKLYKNNSMLDQWGPMAYEYIQKNISYYNDCFDLYGELKEYYGSKWAFMKQKIYDRLDGKQLYRYYKADDEYERLYHAIKYQPNLLLGQYESYLRPYYPKEILAKYHEFLVNYGESAKSRDAYDLIERYLTKMIEYPGGKKIAKALVEDWNARFPTRKVMIQRLNKIKLSLFLS